MFYRVRVMIELHHTRSPRAQGTYVSTRKCRLKSGGVADPALQSAYYGEKQPSDHVAGPTIGCHTKQEAEHKSVTIQ